MIVNTALQNVQLLKISQWRPTFSQSLQSFPMLWGNTVPTDSQMSILIHSKLQLCIYPSAQIAFIYSDLQIITDKRQHTHYPFSSTVQTPVVKDG